MIYEAIIENGTERYLLRFRADNDTAAYLHAFNQLVAGDELIDVSLA